MTPEGKEEDRVHGHAIDEKQNILIYITAMTLCVAAVQVEDKFKTAKPKIAYGGVLNKMLVTNSNNSDIVKAAQFTLTYASKRNTGLIPVTEDGKINESYKITKAKKLKLIYTQDDKEPFKFNARKEKENKIVRSSLVWGYTYSFTVSWDIATSPWQHNFIVTHYWDDKFYIFSHTFYEMDRVQKDSLMNANMRPEHSHTPVLLQSTVSREVDSEFLSDRVPLEHSLAESCTDSNCDEKHHNIYSEEMNRGSETDNKMEKDENVQILKILSYNIWNTNSVEGTDAAYVKRIEKLAAACRQANADVIGFQEVRFQDGRGGTLGPNQVQHLANLLPQYQFVYQPAQIQLDGLPNRIEEGVAIFSKHPIVTHDYLLLTRNAGDNADGHQRILLHAAISLPSKETVHIFNTHLSLSHRARALSVLEIWHHINKHDGPVFLMGDFNAEAHNREIGFLSGEDWIDGMHTEGLQDSWVLKHGTWHLGYTFNTLEDELSKRIDLIFFRTLPHVSLGDIVILDDKGRGPKAASDHLGLLASYLLKKYS